MVLLPLTELFPVVTCIPSDRGEYILDSGECVLMLQSSNIALRTINLRYLNKFGIVQCWST